MNLYDRPLAASLKAALRDIPVVCLLRPRQSGKTTLVRTLEPRYTYVTFDDDATLAFAQTEPAGFAAALSARAILDEIQRVPELLRALKLVVDRERRPGRFVLTGSATLLLLPRPAFWRHSWLAASSRPSRGRRLRFAARDLRACNEPSSSPA